MAQRIDGEVYLDGEEVVALLGVKKATLYAYVSRGVLKSYRQGVGRRRLYLQSEIETLCAIQFEETPPTLTRHQNSDDDVFRDVRLPDAESWAGDH